MKIITFIIPSYNVDRYLNTALQSFITHDEKINEKIEIIVVDDGSVDKTAEIAKEYVKRYPNMFRLIQKENGGHGSTINVGSRKAAGKYFKVIDADDWVITENLSAYIQYLSESDADVILTPFHMVDMNSRERTIQKMYTEDYDRTYIPDELAVDWKSFDRCTTFHGITYRTEFYNRYRHELPEKVFYEDQEYATIPACYAKKIAVLNQYLYQYLVGNGEQSVAKSNQIKRIGHLETVIEHMLAYWSEHNNQNEFSRDYFLKKTEAVVFSYYVIMCILFDKKTEGRKKCKLLNQKIKKQCPELFNLIRNKYSMYVVLSFLHISEVNYEKLIHSSVFRLIRHNHIVEKE